MAIVEGLTNSFKKELLQGLHDFTTSTGNVFKIALYTSDASLGPSTTAYTATGEVGGDNYTAGGATLTNVTPTISSGTALVDFANVSWTAPTFDNARGALIYNSTNGNRSVMVLDFGSNRAPSPDFAVAFPTASNTEALIRIS
jgi:hypothetical protein